MRVILVFYCIIYLALNVTAHAKETCVVSSIQLDNSLINCNNTEFVIADIYVKPERTSAINIRKFIGKELLLNSDIKDRYKRAILKEAIIDDIFLQKYLLENGLAFAYLNSLPETGYKNLLLYEDIARKNKVGIWAENIVFDAKKDLYKIIEQKNKFVLIRGNIYEVKKMSDDTYINFSPDWKTDFTVSISKDYMRYFGREYLKSLIGKSIEVRGIIDIYNGPFIEIYHPELIKLLD